MAPEVLTSNHSSKCIWRNFFVSNLDFFSHSRNPQQRKCRLQLHGRPVFPDCFLCDAGYKSSAIVQLSTHTVTGQGLRSLLWCHLPRQSAEQDEWKPSRLHHAGNAVSCQMPQHGNQAHWRCSAMELFPAGKKNLSISSELAGKQKRGNWESEAGGAHFGSLPSTNSWKTRDVKEETSSLPRSRD